MINCPKCGAPNVEGAVICQECGNPLPARQPTAPTSGTAVGSLVCGILGWTILPLIGSIIAVILGHVAKSEIRASNGTLSGDGMALAGLILGYSSIGLAVLGVILAVLGILFGLALPIGLIGCGLCAG
jgi:hypothetical protein